MHSSPQAASRRPADSPTARRQQLAKRAGKSLATRTSSVAREAPPDDEASAAQTSALLERRRQSSLHARRLLLGRRESGLLCASRRRLGGAGDSADVEEQLSKEELERRRRRIAHLRFRLRFFLKLVVTAYKLCEKHYLTSQRMGDAFQTQQEAVARAEGQLGLEHQLDNVYFSRAEFRANRQTRLSAEARRVLRKRWDDRTETEVNYTVIALRSIQQIADYPVRMQKNLARYGMLESFNPGRVIVRQADPAQAFYFIIYGTVIVAVLDFSAETAHTVVELTRGDSFGELAIMNRSKRQSTVISKTECDLLSIGVDAYEATFMQGGKKTLTDPDHNQFIESLHFLQGWPKEHLKHQHDKFMFCYFKRSTVMVKNSSKSRWIYIIKSGSAQVLLVLRKVTPQVASNTGLLRPQLTSLQRRVQRDPDGGDSPVASNRTALDAFYNSSGVFSPSGISSAEPYPRRPLTPLLASPQTSRSGGSANSRPGTAALSGFGEQAKESGEPPRVHQHHRPLTPSILSTSQSPPPPPHYAMPVRSQTMATLHSSTVPADAEAKIDGSADARSDTKGIRMGRKTFFDDLDAGQVELTEQPEFVHIQTLTRGSVFGLQDMFKQDQPGLCVISNGAECLLLDKEFFLLHSPRGLVDRLRNQVTHYPSRGALQARLQERVNWETYKRLLVQSARVQRGGRSQ